VADAARTELVYLDTMTVDLACLAINAVWGFVLVILEISGKTRIAGASWNAGNRQDAPEFPPWIARTSRAIGNHTENFPLFLTAVVVVHLAGRADEVSAAASVTYVVARAAHGLLYVGGVVGLRSAAFATGAVATFVILSRLVL
jgi:uncharacterized MAPEG superfamily protein